MFQAHGVPLRIKILLALLLVITAVVSTITFTMANLFHQDKKVYVSDLASVVALHIAQEADALIAGYRDRLEICATLLDDPGMGQERKAALFRKVIPQFRGLVAFMT